MSEETVIIENVGISENMQNDAIEAAIEGIDRFNEENAIATYIKVDLSSKHPAKWECVVNYSTENPSPYNTSCYICFIYQQYTIHIWIDKETEDKSEKEPKIPNITENDISSLIAKYDKSGNGKLEFDEFLGFMKEALKLEESQGFLKKMRFLYDGMDTDNSHNLDKNEIIECFSKWKEGNFKWLTKMIFRGADVDKSRKVSICELKSACDNLGKSLNQENFENQCKIEFGAKKKELEYWEFYKIITGETLDKNSIDADPYDGKLQTESKCCILI